MMGENTGECMNKVNWRPLNRAANLVVWCGIVIAIISTFPPLVLQAIASVLLFVIGWVLMMGWTLGTWVNKN